MSQPPTTLAAQGGPPQPALIIVILWMLVFASFAQMVVVAPLVTAMAATLSVSESAVGIIITAHGFLLGAATLITGPISDRVGRRRILMISSGALTASLALHGVATELWSLTLARALSGAAAGITLAGAVSYIGDVFPSARRGRATGWVMSGFAVAQILAAPMATLLGQSLDYRVPFLILALCAGVGFGFCVTRLPRSHIQRADRIRVAEAVRDYGRLLSHPTSAAACAVYAAMLLGISTFITYFPDWLLSDVGLSAGQVALLLAAGGLGNLVAGPTAGRLSDMVGRPWLVAGGSLWAGAVMLLFPHLEGAGVTWLVLTMVALMIGVSTRGSVMQALVTELVPDQMRGRFVSLNLACGHVGFGLGAALAAWLHDRGGFAATAPAAAVSGVVIAVIIALFLRQAGHQPRSAQHAAPKAPTPPLKPLPGE